MPIDPTDTACPDCYHAWHLHDEEGCTLPNCECKTPHPEED